MSSTTTRLGLIRHTTSDVFLISDYFTNWGLLDAAPGIRVVTAATRPTTWTAAHAGMFIYETDTGLAYVWNGSAFVRAFAKGHLISGERTSDFTTTSTTYGVVISATVSVPAGGRNLLVIAEGGLGVTNANGVSGMAIFRDTTQLTSWLQRGGTGATAADQPPPVSMVTVDTVTAGGGSFNFSLQARVDPGFASGTPTTTVKGSATAPVGIHVIEV